MALPDLWVEGRGSSLNSRWHSSGFYTLSGQKDSQSMPISERACNPQWDLRSRKRFCWLVLDSFEWVLAYLMSCSKEEMCQIGQDFEVSDIDKGNPVLPSAGVPYCAENLNG